MLYVDFEAGNNIYKLRLNTRNTVMLEKALGCNPVAIFGDGDTIPKITDMVQVLYYSLLPLNHGINLDTAYNIFDEYLADGHAAGDFINVILDIYRVSGIIHNSKAQAAEAEEDNEKNLITG